MIKDDNLSHLAIYSHDFCLIGSHFVWYFFLLMKIVFIILFASCALFLGWKHHRHSQKTYLKNETYIKDLKKDVFFAKWRSPLPQWIEDQMAENFLGFEKGITEKQIDATFSQIQSALPSPYIVRYRIFGNELYRYFRDGELISLEDNSTERAIKTLMQWIALPNIDCIVSFYDGIRPNHVFFHTPSKDLQAPLLISAKIKDTPYIVLIPDWRSLDQWWASDIKSIRSRIDRFPWDQKKEFAIWRGTCNREERKKLCRLSLQYPSYLDAKFNIVLDDPDPEKEGMLGENISWEKFLECKFLPYVDGYMTASPALQWRLLSKCLTFKPQTDEVQWFTRALIPYVHYVPVKTDLSDLIDRFEWAKAHDLECRQIAENASRFALDHLMFEDIYLYFNALIHRYAALQKIDWKKLRPEMQSDPHWVNIQYRKDLQKLAEKNQMKGFLDGSSPGGGIISFSNTSPVP